jgi:hypothetical protein
MQVGLRGLKSAMPVASEALAGHTYCTTDDNPDGMVMWMCVPTLAGGWKWRALSYDRDSPVTLDTLCCWRMDEDSGAVLANSGTVGAPGNFTVEGNLALGYPTPQGHGVLCTAADSPSAYSAAGIAEPTTGFCAAVWICLSEQTGAATPGYIMAKSAQPATWPGTHTCFDIRVTNANGSWTIELLTVAGMQTLAITAADHRLIPGAFSRLGCNYDVATGVLTAYRNGVAVGTLTVAAGPGRAIDWQGHGRWYIGTHPSVLVGAPASQQVSGIVAVARVYSAAQPVDAWHKVFCRGMGYLNEDI